MQIVCHRSTPPRPAGLLGLQERAPHVQPPRKTGLVSSSLAQLQFQPIRFEYSSYPGESQNFSVISFRVFPILQNLYRNFYQYSLKQIIV